MGATVGGIRGDLFLETAAFIRDMKKAGQAVASNSAKMRQSMRAVERASSNVQRSFAQLRSGVAVLVGALAVRQFKNWTTAAIESGGAIKDTAEKIGIGVEALQQLRFAAAQVGVGQNALDMGLQRFSRRLGEVAQGQGELKDTLALYNIETKDASGNVRSNVDVLGDLADAVKNAGSAQEQLRIAFKAFDSEGAALVNLLKEGKEGLKAYMQQAVDFGVVMSHDVVAQAKLASDNLTTLQFIAKTAFNTSIIKQFAGSLILSRESMESVRDAAANFGRLVGASMRLVAASAVLVGRYLREIASALAAIVALKAVAVFGTLAISVVKFSQALIAAARAGNLVNLIMSRSALGILAKLAIALGAATIVYQSLSGEIDKTSKSIEKLIQSMQLGSQATSDSTKNIQESIEQKRRDIDGWNLLTQKLYEGERAYKNAQAAIDIVNEAARLGVDANTRLGQTWKEVAMQAYEAQRRHDDLKESLEKSRDAGREVGQTLGNAFEDAVVNGSKMDEVIKALEKDLLRLAIRTAVTKPLSDFLGGVFSGSIGSIGSAKGNAFVNGRVQTFASGGILDRPTVFPMAGGKVGVGGEAGTEAILPLTRMSGGDLGVKAQGGSNVLVQVNNYASDTTTRERRERGPDGERVIIDVVKKAQARGEFDDANRLRFGTRPRKVI